MTNIVYIISKVDVFSKSIFRVEEIQFRIPLSNGKMSKTVIRLNLNRGDSVACIVHNPKEKTVVLVEQFRYSTYENGSGWLLELPAGIFDSKIETTPEETLEREIEEEIGFRLRKAELVSKFYLSPGGSSEQVYLFYSSVCSNDKVCAGGGIPEEGEFIRPVTMTVDEAYAQLKKGKIIDAKTIIGLQWLRSNHE